jgi:hypothetical protein
VEIMSQYISSYEEAMCLAHEESKKNILIVKQQTMVYESLKTYRGVKRK